MCFIPGNETLCQVVSNDTLRFIRGLLVVDEETHSDLYWFNMFADDVQMQHSPFTICLIKQKKTEPKGSGRHHLAKTAPPTGRSVCARVLVAERDGWLHQAAGRGAALCSGDKFSFCVAPG